MFLGFLWVKIKKMEETTVDIDVVISCRWCVIGD